MVFCYFAGKNNNNFIVVKFILRYVSQLNLSLRSHRKREKQSPRTVRGYYVVDWFSNINFNITPELRGCVQISLSHRSKRIKHGYLNKV